MKVNESIEIPFGAFDSERKGWVYTIPEGMEAEINDGKIIVREKESEDENIGREIITYLKLRKEESVIKDPYIKWIAWLEKQGEQKPSEWSDEDEKMIGKIRSIIEQYAFSQSAVDVNGDLFERKFIEPDEWLRTLKFHVHPQWKPSDEQMKTLEKATRHNAFDSDIKGTLYSLYNDLKKLKG